MIRILESREYYTEHERELNKEEKKKYEEDKLKVEQEAAAAGVAPGDEKK
jgi:hypothetical protein